MRARAWGGLTGKMSGGGLRSVAWASVITLVESSVITLVMCMPITLQLCLPITRGRLLEWHPSPFYLKGNELFFFKR